MNPKHQHEKTDAQAKPLLQFAVVLSGVILFTMVFVFLMFRVMEASWSAMGKETFNMAKTRQLPDAPLLQRDEPGDYVIFEHEQEALDGYAWSDRKKGTVTVPIERAMELVVREKEIKTRR